mgnify:CR=1 FL=1
MATGSGLDDLGFEPVDDVVGLEHGLAVDEQAGDLGAAGLGAEGSAGFGVLAGVLHLDVDAQAVERTQHLSAVRAGVVLVEHEVWKGTHNGRLGARRGRLGSTTEDPLDEASKHPPLRG